MELMSGYKKRINDETEGVIIVPASTRAKNVVVNTSAARRLFDLMDERYEEAKRAQEAQSRGPVPEMTPRVITTKGEEYSMPRWLRRLLITTCAVEIIWGAIVIAIKINS